MSTPYEKLVLDLANADPAAGRDAPERVRLREYLEQHPDKAGEVLAGLKALALEEEGHDLIDASAPSDLSGAETSLGSGSAATNPDRTSSPSVIGRIGAVLAAAAAIALGVGVWWMVTSGSPASGPAPSVQIVELAPLDTDSWRPFSLERKVLPANHAYRLSPVDVDNNYLAVRDSTGMTLTPLSDVAGDNWVVSIRGREGETASLLFMARPEEMSDTNFRRAVESQFASIPSTPSIEPGFRLAHATDGTRVEHAGGVSLGSPDDPPPPTPQWASDLADQLRAEGIQISGWTFPLNEE